MKKTAVFVEGQTELVFVREYLLKRFEYSNIGIECYTLFTDNNFTKTEYSFPDDVNIRENSENFFQIINVGNDKSVPSRILHRAQYLWNVGFQRIIGLRDMYSKQYRDLLKQSGIIDNSLNQEFIDESKQEFERKAKKPDCIDFCFAIMEGESWILGFHHCFEKLNPLLTTSYINEKLGFDLEQIDPEITFFHPANVMERIYDLVDENYNKSKGNISEIMSALQKDDFELLANSGKCNSFRKFTSYIK